MPIKLDDERTAYPAVKFNKEGDKVQIAVVRIETLPLTAYGSNDPILGKDGQPRKQTRITGVVMKGSATIKDGETPRTVKEGELVSLYMKGLSRFEFFNAKKKLDGDFTVGDLLIWMFTGTAPGQAPGTTKKLYSVLVKKGTDAKLIETCESHYHSLLGQSATEEEPTHAAAPATDEYDPFADE